MPTPKELATAYFDAWQRGDFDRLTGLLDPEVTFDGPLARLTGRDDAVRGLRGLAEITERVSIGTMQGDDTDVITWFDLHTSIAEPTSTANWMHTANGRIRAIRVTFDPRQILAAGD